jgi:hypothetical protein
MFMRIEAIYSNAIACLPRKWTGALMTCNFQQDWYKMVDRALSTVNWGRSLNFEML